MDDLPDAWLQGEGGLVPLQVHHTVRIDGQLWQWVTPLVDGGRTILVERAAVRDAAPLVYRECLFDCALPRIRRRR